jgi:hypothetical protein
MYKFIENGERYSKSDINWEKPFNINTNEIHPLGYTGFGCDDFLLAEKRNKPLLTLFTRQCFRKGTSNDHVIDKYFLLLNNIPHEITELLKTSKQSTSYLEFASDNSYVILHLGKTNKGGDNRTRNTKIFSPLIYLTEGGHSLPCWDEEQWRLFGLTPTGEMCIALSTAKAPLFDKKPLWDDSHGNKSEQKLKNSLKSMKEKATLIAEQSGRKGKSLRKGNRITKTKGDTTENEDSDDDLFEKKERPNWVGRMS